MKLKLLGSIGLLLVGCAQLHHVQIGDIQSNPKFSAKKFEIKISETGVNLKEASDIVAATSKGQGSKDLQEAADIIAMFQMGPRTGNPVYTKDYAKDLINLIYKECPSGNITGINSIRETRKYPVISGEIVKITGYCLTPKGS